MLVDDFLSASAARSPDRIAVVCGDERWTYAQVESASTRFAVRLLEESAHSGDRVVICLDNSFEAVVAVFGALKAACAFVIVDPRASLDHLRAILVDSGAAAVLARRPHLDSIEEERPTLPSLRAIICAETEFTHVIAEGCGSARRLPLRRSEEDLAALVYTSGSTGEPKGVMLTHRNIASAAAAICTYLGNSEDDVILNALPLAFTYGLGQVTTAFRAGATVVLERSFSYPRAIIETLQREGVTGLPLVPTMATLLLRQNLDGFHVPSLRYITNAAAALPENRARALLETFPQAKLYSMYGQTECQRVSYLPPDQLALRPDSVGIPIPGTSARVADDSGRTVREGVVGELLVRGPHVMAGYWNRPEATRAVLRPAPDACEIELHTGDLFRTDADGFLYFVERKDDIIKCGGEKVAPKRIEHVIAQLAGVAEVAVFGVPDPILGEAVTAVVGVAGGMTLTADDVRRHCQRHLDPHEVPRRVDVQVSLPTTLTGKISRRALKTAAMAERGSI